MSQQEENKKGEQKGKVFLKSKESKDKRFKPDEETDKKEEGEEKQGFFSKYFWYILFFIAFQIGLKFFNQNPSMSNIPKLKGIIEEGTKFDIVFYLSSQETPRSLKELTPIYTIKDMIYSYTNFSSSSFDNKVNITYNISYLQKKKNNKNSGLYLIAELKLKGDVFKQLNKYKQAERSDFLRSINILKYVEDLSDLLNSGKDLDDLNSGREVVPEKNNSNNAIPRLYY